MTANLNLMAKPLSPILPNEYSESGGHRPFDLNVHQLLTRGEFPQIYLP